MKVLLINGSPNKNGCTNRALEEVARTLRAEGIETQIFQIGNQKVWGCTGCNACEKTGRCIHDDDAANHMLELMKEADGILLGSPVYSANISSNMQALLERAAVVCDMNPGLMRYKVGAAVAAVRRAGSIQAIDAMNHFFLNHEMFVAGSTYWNMAYGQMPGDVLQNEEGMNNMRNLGQNMAYLLKAVNNIAAPEAGNSLS